MTIEQLNEGNRIAARIDELKGFSFYRTPDYEKASESLHLITVYFDGGKIDLDLVYENQDLKEYFKEHLLKIEEKKQQEIKLLESKLADL